MKPTIIIDCDGVLTDGKVYYSGSGERQKAFHSRDIPAINGLCTEYEVIILTSSTWRGLVHFAKRIPKAKIVCAKDKAAWVRENNITQFICVCDDNSDLYLCEMSSSVYIPEDACRGLRQNLLHVPLKIIPRKGGDGVISELRIMLVNDRLNISQ